MKRILTLILTICMVLPFVSMNLYAHAEDNGYWNPARVTIEDDSVLILSTEDETIEDIKLTIFDSLEYQEVVLPYGTDFSKVKFNVVTDNLHFSLSEDIMRLHNIDAEHLDGYFKYLAKRSIRYAKGTEEYERVPDEGLTLEEGAVYTISIDSDGTYDVEPNGKSWDEDGLKRWMQVNESAKFAFTVSTGDPVVLEGTTHEMVAGTDKPLTIKVDKEFSKFKGVEYAGKELKKDKDYTAVSGSTVVTLSGDFLKNLTVGEHTIKILFADANTTATIKVTEKQAAPSTTGIPNTGDSAAIGFTTLLLLCSVVTIVFVSKKRKHA